ncbi:MAG TPA: 2,3,4,5-tetrahydropyridine-2,6-dicarboxylate N-succinyltransferase, partial [Acidobacteriaceae bacterium]|nr:2,3,4,5-tetrahydropyridine-2,6-dicarboxylate N-succinyltransferase [Acidobacteriaceae bacterium]
MSAPNPLQQEIERHFAAGAAAIGDPAALEAFTQLRCELNSGRVRSAEPDPEAFLGWRVNSWVKRGILLGFRIGQLAAFGNHDLSFVDKS